MFRYLPSPRTRAALGALRVLGKGVDLGLGCLLGIDKLASLLFLAFVVAADDNDLRDASDSLIVVIGRCVFAC